METGGKVFVGHLWAFCPWTMMVMMMISLKNLINKIKAIHKEKLRNTNFRENKEITEIDYLI